jgi:hypothetical protein
MAFAFTLEVARPEFLSGLVLSAVVVFLFQSLGGLPAIVRWDLVVVAAVCLVALYRLAANTNLRVRRRFVGGK